MCIVSIYRPHLHRQGLPDALQCLLSICVMCAGYKWITAEKKQMLQSAERSTAASVGSLVFPADLWLPSWVILCSRSSGSLRVSGRAPNTVSKKDLFVQPTRQKKMMNGRAQEQVLTNKCWDLRTTVQRFKMVHIWDVISAWLPLTFGSLSREIHCTEFSSVKEKLQGVFFSGHIQ